MPILHGVAGCFKQYQIFTSWDALTIKRRCDEKYFGLRPLNWMVTVLTVVMRETDPVQTKRERIRSLDIFHSFSKRHRMGSQRLEVFFSWIVNTMLRKVNTIAREVMQLEIFFFGISCFLPLFKNDVIDNRHVNCLSTLECEGTLRYSWY